MTFGPDRDRPCDHYAAGRDCGATPARRYLPGWRCPAHTPAALKGQHEPGQAATPAAAKLAAALATAARRWRVFPVRPGDKRPAFPDHDADHCTGRDPRCRTGHTGWEPRATTDPARIRRAWTAAPYEIGIAAGPSGLVVIDLDTPKPGQAPPPEWDLPGVRTGADVLAVLCERAGQPWPGDTYTVRTGRGGTHLVYTAPPGAQLRNTQGAKGGLGWLIDTRAHGGYVIGAGSAVAGRPYTLTRDAPAAPLPEWLAALLAPRPLPPQEPVTIPVRTGRGGAFLTAAIRGEVERVTSSGPDEHNTALYRAAVALGQLAAGGALDPGEVTGWLAAAAGQVGQGPGEARRTIASGLRAGAKRPRSVAA
jgi:hypothetical protein